MAIGGSNGDYPGTAELQKELATNSPGRIDTFNSEVFARYGGFSKKPGRGALPGTEGPCWQNLCPTTSGLTRSRYGGPVGFIPEGVDLYEIPE